MVRKRQEVQKSGSKTKKKDTPIPSKKENQQWKKQKETNPQNWMNPKKGH